MAPFRIASCFLTIAMLAAVPAHADIGADDGSETPPAVSDDSGDAGATTVHVNLTVSSGDATPAPEAGDGSTATTNG